MTLRRPRVYIIPYLKTVRHWKTQPGANLSCKSNVAAIQLVSYAV